MALIDFKEISKANVASGNQDCFELFAREFLNALGFSIIEDPDRGQDGGRDLIVSEKRAGIISNTEVRWLVSCKHKIHSGASVIIGDEGDISDRIQAHKCNGFMGIYSSIVSSSLNRKLKSLSDKYEIQVFDNEKIERILLENRNANKLIRRFFPQSYNKMELKAPSNLLDEYLPLRCKVCGRDLLQRDILDRYLGIVVFVRDKEYNEKNKYTDVYCVCKGECDRNMVKLERSRENVTGWNDISDLVIPIRFLKFVIALMNRIRSHEDVFTEEAYSNLKNTIISLAQTTMKRQSEEDIRRDKSLWDLSG